MTEDSLQEFAKLEYLAVRPQHHVLCITRGCYMRLTALATLRLEACGLTGIPSALTALGGSLTTLALPLNDELQLADHDIVTLLALRKLQNLDLRK